MTLRLAILAAGIAFAHGEFHVQIEAVNKSIAQAPRNSALYVKRGEMYRMHGDWVTAESDFDRALVLDPNAAEAILGRARMAADRGGLVRALALLGEYLVARPNSEVGFALRADVGKRLGKWKEAAADYEVAIRISTEPTVDYYLGKAEALSKVGSDGAAIEAIDAGISRLGALVTLDQWAVDFLVSKKRWNDALNRHSRMVASAPRKESALTRHGEILMAAGRFAQAKVSFQAALEAWEQLPERLRTMQAMQDLRIRIAEGIGGASRR